MEQEFRMSGNGYLEYDDKYSVSVYYDYEGKCYKPVFAVWYKEENWPSNNYLMIGRIDIESVIDRKGLEERARNIIQLDIALRSKGENIIKQKSSKK